MFGAVSGAQHSTLEVGSESGGFRVVGGQSSLRIAVRGYWPPEVARAFGKDATAALQKLPAAGTFVLDATEFKTQGAEGQEALRLFLRAASGMAFAKGAAVAKNVLTRMQLTRLIRECGLDDRLEFSDSWNALPGASGDS